MIIKDKEGQTYEIVGGELREVNAPIGNYFITLTDFPRKSGSVKGGLIVTPLVNSSGVRKSESWYVDFEERSIGCRSFLPATFAKILKAAGIKTAKARKKRKR